MADEQCICCPFLEVRPCKHEHAHPASLAIPNSTQFGIRGRESRREGE